MEGGIGLIGNLKLGYDAQGLLAYRAEPSKPDVLFDGFYIDTTEPLLSITGWKDGAPSEDIISLVGRVIANLSITEYTDYLGISLPSWIDDIIGGTLEFGASGDIRLGLQGQLHVELAGNDDKFRPSKLDAGDCLFEIDPARSNISIGGGVTVRASARAQIPGLQEIFNFFGRVTGTRPIQVSVDWSSGDINVVEFPSKTLFAFEANCDGFGGGGATPAEILNPQLAMLDRATGTLRINVGSFVGGAPNEGMRQIPADGDQRDCQCPPYCWITV